MKKSNFKSAAEWRNYVDRDSSKVLLSFFTSGVFWLLVGSTLAILASFKMHMPNFLGDISWLTFGRVRPLHLNTMVYGWASMTGAGVALWLLTRTLRVVIPHQWIILTGLALWNIGLTIGSFQILGGYSRGLEWLDLHCP